MQLHPSQRPSIGKSFKSLVSSLTLAFHECENVSCQYPVETLAQLILCHRPFDTQITPSCECMILDILLYEFGDIAYKFFTNNYHRISYAPSGQQVRSFFGNEMLVEQIKHKKQIVGNWPQLPTSKVIMECLKNY